MLETDKTSFYELWLQHKQLETMEMNEAWPFDEKYIHQFQFLEAAETLSLKMEHLSNDHIDHHKKHGNSLKQCTETRQPVANLM